jgi:hypothetical protein
LVGGHDHDHEQGAYGGGQQAPVVAHQIVGKPVQVLEIYK